jgi:hypothetical protein
VTRNDRERRVLISVDEYQRDGVVHFRPFLGNRRSRGSGRPLRVGLDQRGYFVRWRPISLPGSGVLVLQRSEAQQGEPVWMAFAGHQLVGGGRGRGSLRGHHGDQQA